MMVAPVLVEPYFQLNSPNQTLVLESFIYNIVAGISITSKTQIFVLSYKKVLLIKIDFKIHNIVLNMQDWWNWQTRWS